MWVWCGCGVCLMGRWRGGERWERKMPTPMYPSFFLWGPCLTVPPGSSPPGGAFFPNFSTQVKPTWWCLSVFQTFYEGNLFHTFHLKEDSVCSEDGEEGKEREEDEADLCVTFVFLTSPSKRKLQPPTNQPTTQPTSTNIQHGGPPSTGPPNISLSSFTHSSYSFSPV